MKAAGFAKATLLLLVAAVFSMAGWAVAHEMGAKSGTVAGMVADAGTGLPISGARVTVSGKGLSANTGSDGSYKLSGVPAGSVTVTCSKSGYGSQARSVSVFAGATTTVNFKLSHAPEPKPVPEEAEVKMKEKRVKVSRKKDMKGRMAMPAAMAPPPGRPIMPQPQPGLAGEGQVEHNTEAYDRIYENPFLAALENPLSTFSIDVDTASYANARRFINRSQLPPADAVRVEEFINYFTYDYPNPKGKTPFSITTEISTAPWNEDHRLVHIGLQGKKVDISKLPAQNLVFLLDVSGSMNSPHKLPLLKAAFKLLVGQLRPDDRVAIVVYAGAAGLVLPSTNGNEGDKIVAALDSLSAGGSTAGGAGIKLAYKTAIDNFIKGGNNRIILATDGDFNVGQSSDGELVRMIEEKREHGVFLTILGFGMGNYKDSKMEKLADKGNGNYGYIDSILEAKKMLVTEMGGTLLTIAKDVKIQVEFNPAKVKGYRLIGYENRMLRKEDFDDDKKDAGELGAGHTVTVLYEIIPAGSKEEIPGSGELKYQDSKISDAAKKSKELMTVKLRYKKPDGKKSKLIVQPLIDTNVTLKKTSDNFRFSAAVASFGLILRDSKHKGDATFADVLSLAKNAKGKDKEGYRYEFIKLVEKASLLKQTK